MSINIPSSKELIKAFMDRYKTAEARYRRRGVEAMRNLEAVRIKKSSDYVARKLREAATSMPFLNDLHEFHKELLLLNISEAEYRRATSKVFNASRAVKSIRREALMMIKGAAGKGDVIKARRRFMARMVDLLSDLSQELDELRMLGPNIRHMPSIDVGLPTIVVAGMPNTGKSSFVACVSTAKPEIADYPFTTKKIIVGHVKLFGDFAVQVLDTPGLLDRPLSERNKIELQTVLALRHLAHVIIMIIDPTPHSGNSLEEQLRLLEEIRGAFKSPVMVVLNKVDIAAGDEVERAEAALGGTPYKAAAAKCLGTNDVIRDAIDKYVMPRLAQGTTV